MDRVTVYDLAGRVIGSVDPADVKPPPPLPPGWRVWTYALLEGDAQVALVPEAGWPKRSDSGSAE
ncbi:MAG: hypothetical protein WBF51_01690 [Candidatus Dormiibacterota bacterium]